MSKIPDSDLFYQGDIVLICEGKLDGCRGKVIRWVHNNVYIVNVVDEYRISGVFDGSRLTLVERPDFDLVLPEKDR